MYAVNAADGEMRWKFATMSAVNSSPAVAEGHVYFGSVDGFFYAVDAESGELKWKFKTDCERRFSAPGVHGMMPRTEVMPDRFNVFLSSPAVSAAWCTLAAATITSMRWTRRPAI